MRKMLTLALFTVVVACTKNVETDAATQVAGTYQVMTLKYNGDVYKFKSGTLAVSTRGANQISLDALTVDGLSMPMVGVFNVSKSFGSEIAVEGGRGLYNAGTLSLKFDFTTGNGKTNAYELTATK